MKNLIIVNFRARHIIALILLVAFLSFVSVPVLPVVAAPLVAVTPNLGAAASFAILSSTYTNTVSGTTINGDLGYTTAPATTPTVNGGTFSPPAPEYTAAGLAQAAALVALNSQPCDFTFADGAIDLATDATHGTSGVYAPGIYCTGASSAATIGSGGTITLSGNGTYIFRITGALTTSANSVVALANGASVCDVFWTPIEATTLGANSTFAGTDIDEAGITIGSTVGWSGRALAFGGTVTTDTDTISRPACAGAVSLSTNLSDSNIRVGRTVFDSATLSGETNNAGGSVTYTVYSDNACTLNSQDAGTVTVTNGVIPDSSALLFNATGTFFWQAVYSGDTNNPGVASLCGSEVLTVNASPTGVPPTGVPSTNVPVPTATFVSVPTSAPGEVATTLPVVGLPNSGGAPPQSNNLPWIAFLASLAIGAIALGLGSRARRRSQQSGR